MLHPGSKAVISTFKLTCVTEKISFIGRLVVQRILGSFQTKLEIILNV